MFPLPPLPFGYDALAPAMSEKTLRLHHDKHHATYVKKTNEMVEKKGLTSNSLESLISEAAGRDKPLFQNAAQAWNHAFFWQSMTAHRKAPDGALAAAIQSSFGGQPQLKAAFVACGAEHFGSGWVWLVADASGGLKVVSTHDADDLVASTGVTPLIVCDLWEHAYYLDYQNDRKAFLETWFDALPHWDFAASQLAAARSGQGGWRYPAPERAAQAA